MPSTISLIKPSNSLGSILVGRVRNARRPKRTGRPVHTKSSIYPLLPEESQIERPVCCHSVGLKSFPVVMLMVKRAETLLMGKTTPLSSLGQKYGSEPGGKSECPGDHGVDHKGRVQRGRNNRGDRALFGKAT